MQNKINTFRVFIPVLSKGLDLFISNNTDTSVYLIKLISKSFDQEINNISLLVSAYINDRGLLSACKGLIIKNIIRGFEYEFRENDAYSDLTHIQITNYLNIIMQFCEENL